MSPFNTPVKAKRCLLALTTIVCLIQSALSRTPEASSTLLKMHTLYAQQPPHDTTLYNVLRVTPNATLAQIQKSYRVLTRELHPDKQVDNNKLGTDTTLEQVREAYEVLKDDSTRLPYHKYGLFHANHAAFLFTGAVTNDDQRALLNLMGYYDTSVTTHSHSQRVQQIAAHLLERIRPLVEGAMTKSALADSIAQECDRLKKLPLGAQIIRCVGRAYRHSGQRVLRHTGVERLKRKFRGAKQVLDAAAAGGRVVLTEHFTLQPKNRLLPQIECRELGALISEDDDLSNQLHSDTQVKEMEYRKSQIALLESLQIEALWKITKIDLDRTIQDACALILDGNYFFFPSHQQQQRTERDGDGWVGSTGVTVDAHVGRLMAASALVLIGDVMVQCSKVGTSWVE